MAANPIALRRSRASVRLALVVFLLAGITAVLGLVLEIDGLPFWWAIVFVLTVLPFALGNGIKRMCLRALEPNLLFHAATFQQFPDLALEKLRAYSTELNQAGFVQLADLGVTDDRGPAAAPENKQAARLSMIVRLFAHPQYQCYGYLTQSFARNSELPLACTLLTRFEEGWRFSTANGKPRRILSLFRAARSIGTRYPDFSVTQLIERHLAERAEIQEDLGAEIMPIVTVESFARLMQEERLRQRAILQQRLGIVLLFELILASRQHRNGQSKYQWWGDYERIRKEKRGMRDE